MKLPRPNVTLFIPDTHSPYLDNRAFNLTLQVARAITPSRCVILGDFQDCATISTHSKDPSRLHNFKVELATTSKLLDRLDAVGFKQKVYIEGNHEYRLIRYLQDKAPELIGLGVDMPSLLKLESRGWEWVPYKTTYQIGHLNVTHNVGSGSGPLAAKKAREIVEGNIIIGHNHAMATYYSGNAKGKTRIGASFGWLGDKSRVDYMHRLEVDRNWQLGFGLGYEVAGVFHIQAVPIIDYTCVVNGELYRG